MTLYEIDNAILACVDQETGEIIDGKALTALQMERDKKIENVACWVKDLKAEAEALKNEIASLTARKKAAENKVERLKSWLAEALDGEIFSTSKVKVSYTHSTKLNVIDEQSVVNYIQTHCQESEQYLKFLLPEIRKDAVKDAMKRGELKEVPGCCLDVSESVVIK